MSAVSKSQRQRMIADWLRTHGVGSQEEVVARLALAGLAATQATVSRDLDELGAVKVRREGTIRWLARNRSSGGPMAHHQLSRKALNVLRPSTLWNAAS